MESDVVVVVKEELSSSRDEDLSDEGAVWMEDDGEDDDSVKESERALEC